MKTVKFVLAAVFVLTMIFCVYIGASVLFACLMVAAIYFFSFLTYHIFPRTDLWKNIALNGHVAAIGGFISYSFTLGVMMLFDLFGKYPLGATHAVNDQWLAAGSALVPAIMASYTFFVFLDGAAYKKMEGNEPKRQ